MFWKYTDSLFSYMHSVIVLPTHRIQSTADNIHAGICISAPPFRIKSTLLPSALPFFFLLPDGTEARKPQRGTELKREEEEEEEEEEQRQKQKQDNPVPRILMSQG